MRLEARCAQGLEAKMKRFHAFGLIGPVILALAAGCGAAKKDNGDGQQNSGGGAGSGNSPNMSGGNANDDGNANNGASGSGAANSPGAGGNSGAQGGGGEAGMKGSGASGTNGGGGNAGVPMEVKEMLDPDVDWEALTLVFPVLYSAFDGEHTFQIPVHVDMATVALEDWQAIPSDAVTFDPDPEVEGGVMITIVKGVEDITIAAHSDKIGGTAPLHVTLATPEEWAVGEMRYHNGVDYELPELTFDQLVDPNWQPPPTPKNLACNNCHSTGAKYFEIQHTPNQIGALSDDVLIQIFTTGMKPEGVPYHILPPDLEHLYSEFHTWEASDEERKGLIVYLRSLTPMGQGDIVIPDGLFPMM
jgi:hypothetical protein